MPSRADIVAAARSLIGARFRRGGRSPSSLDCVGLIVLTGEAVGLTIEDNNGYNFDPKPEFFLQHIRKQSEPGSMAKPLHGQICMFRQAAFPMHLGILTLDRDQPMVINANLKKRLVVEQPLSDWKNLLIALRDFKGVS